MAFTSVTNLILNNGFPTYDIQPIYFSNGFPTYDIQPIYFRNGFPTNDIWPIYFSNGFPTDKMMIDLLYLQITNGNTNMPFQA